MSAENANVFAALRAGFPVDTTRCAVQTPSGLRYSWHDLDAASAMMSNLLRFLELPVGTRVAVQVDPCVESLMLYLAILRAGLVFVPLRMVDSTHALSDCVQTLQPGLVVCAGRQFGAVSKLAFLAGVTYVLTLNADRTGTLLQRASHFPSTDMVAHRQASDVAVLVRGADTDGRPGQWTPLRHGDLLGYRHPSQDAWDWRPDRAIGERLLERVSAETKTRL